MSKPETGKKSQDFKASEAKFVFDAGSDVAKVEALKNKIADLKEFKVSIETARQHLSGDNVAKELKRVDKEIATLEKKLQAIPETPGVEEHVDEALTEDEIARHEGAEEYVGELEEKTEEAEPLPSVMVDKEYLRRAEEDKLRAKTDDMWGEGVKKMDEDAEIDAAFDKAESGKMERTPAIKEGRDAAEKRLNAEIAAEQEKVLPLEKFLKEKGEETTVAKAQRERSERRHAATPEMGKLDKDIRLTEEHVDKMEEQLQDLEKKIGLTEAEYQRQQATSRWSQMKFALRRLTDPDFDLFIRSLDTLDEERKALEHNRKRHEWLSEKAEDPEGAAKRAKEQEAEAKLADIIHGGRGLHASGGGKGASRIGNIVGKG